MAMSQLLIQGSRDHKIPHLLNGFICKYLDRGVGGLSRDNKITGEYNQFCQDIHGYANYLCKMSQVYFPLKATQPSGRELA